MTHDPAKRIPDVDPNTPPFAKVMLTLRIIHTTERSFQVEQRDVENGRAWLPRSIVGSNPTQTHGGAIFHLPLWLFRKVREQI